MTLEQQSPERPAQPIFPGADNAPIPEQVNQASQAQTDAQAPNQSLATSPVGTASQAPNQVATAQAVRQSQTADALAQEATAQPANPAPGQVPGQAQTATGTSQPVQTQPQSQPQAYPNPGASGQATPGAQAQAQAGYPGQQAPSTNQAPTAHAAQAQAPAGIQNPYANHPGQAGQGQFQGQVNYQQPGQGLAQGQNTFQQAGQPLQTPPMGYAQQMQMAQAYQGAPYQPAPPQKNKAPLVLAIIAIAFELTALLNLVGLILGVIGLLIAINKNKKPFDFTSEIILNSIAIATPLIISLLNVIGVLLNLSLY